MRPYFRFITAHPVPVLILAGVVGALGGGAILRLTRDTSPDAFIPSDHQALRVKHEIDQRFGLTDPIAVAVIREAPGTIFNPHTLDLIQRLTTKIQALPGFAPGDVISIATESGVFFEEGLPGFEFLLKKIPDTDKEMAALQADVLGYELYRGTLVAEDGSAAAIIIRPPEKTDPDELYRTIRDLLAQTPVRDERIVVAGEAAVQSHMGREVSDDALRMNFIAPVVIFMLIVLAYRTARGTILPMCVVGGASALALGSMAMAGVPVFIVTNGIFVIIMALGVADSLHLNGQYYEEQLDLRGRDRREVIVDACGTLWYPLLITSVTDLAGFFALYLVGGMPPIAYFGLFTCVGIAGALFYSYTVIPAGLAVLPLRTGRVFGERRRHRTGPGRVGIVGRLMGELGGFVYRRRKTVLLVGGACLAVALAGATRLRVNDARILAFKDHHPIVRAAAAINQRFDGTSHLDVVITASEPGAMLQPEMLARIEALETFAESLPQVGGAHSVAGWVKRAHEKMNKEDPAFYAIPDDPTDTQFYLDTLLGPTSPMARLLREVVDPTYSEANVIVRMQSSEYIHQREVVTRLESYLHEHFADDSLETTLAGRVNLDYHWLQMIRSSHVRSVCFSFACVLVLTGLMFRSLTAGVLCTLTVGTAVLVNYGFMGLSGIPLGVGTSMFASIAIGAGVNFPIHLLDRLRVDLRRPDLTDPEAVFRDALTFTGRALFFTAFVLAIGFLLLCVSEFRTLVRFGLLIGLGVAVSFLASVTLLPAAVAVLRPRFLRRGAARERQRDGEKGG